jgi:hypothetical protein
MHEGNTTLVTIIHRIRLILPLVFHYENQFRAIPELNQHQTGKGFLDCKLSLRHLNQ